jgi:hypothetical protein
VEVISLRAILLVIDNQSMYLLTGKHSSFSYSGGTNTYMLFMFVCQAVNIEPDNLEADTSSYHFRYVHCWK